MHVKGDFLYIDSDTIVCSPLDDIEKVAFDLGGVPDQHMPLSQNSHAINFKRYIEKVSGTKAPAKYDTYFNSGVLWVRDVESNYKFFKDWNEVWLRAKDKGIRLDQPSLAYANYKNDFKIKQLDGIWNCQVWFGANYLSMAKIIHYFASVDNQIGGYGKFSVEMPQKIKSGEPLNENDWDLIQNARNVFPSPNAIIAGADYEIFKSSLCGLLRALYKRKRLFGFMEFMLYSFRVLRSKILFEKK